MKKIYLAPRMKAVFMDEEEMVCTSLDNAGKAVDSGIKEADSRQGFINGRSVWDDETE